MTLWALAHGARLAAAEEEGRRVRGRGRCAGGPLRSRRSGRPLTSRRVSLLPGLVPPLLRPAIAAAAAAAAAASSPPPPLLLPLRRVPAPCSCRCRSRASASRLQLTRCLGPIDGWLRYVRSPPLSPPPLPLLQPRAPGPRRPPRPGGAGGRVQSWALAGTLCWAPLSCKFNMLHFTPLGSGSGAPPPPTPSRTSTASSGSSSRGDLAAAQTRPCGAPRLDMAAWLLPQQLQQQQQHAAAAASGWRGARGGGGEGGGDGRRAWVRGSTLRGSRPDAARLEPGRGPVPRVGAPARGGRQGRRAGALRAAPGGARRRVECG